jgi:hypothetical protein
MSMTCRFCHHPKRTQEERRLVAGDPERTIAQRLGISRTAVWRHRKHVAGTIAKAKLANELVSAEQLSAEIVSFRRGVARLIKKAEKDKDWRAAMAGFGELRRQVEARGKLGGQLKEAPGGGLTNNYVIVFEGGIPQSRPAIEATAVEVES